MHAKSYERMIALVSLAEEHLQAPQERIRLNPIAPTNRGTGRRRTDIARGL